MKIAIIGSGVMALKASKHFLELGAEIRIFKSSKHWGGLIRHHELRSNLDRENFSNFEELLNFSKDLEESGLVRNGRVLRVQKRFLAPNSQPLKSSRFADLFRVIYKIDAKKIVEDNRDEQREIFEKLDETIIESLKSSVEAYEDFDVVMDASGPLGDSLSMGAAGTLALNENAIKEDDHIYYGREVLEASESLKSEKFKELVIVGDGLFNLIAINRLKDFFLNNERINLHIICSALSPFKELGNENCDALLKGYDELLELNERSYQAEIDEFNKKVMDWKNLESHERVKIPRPAEPRPRLMIYNGAVISSVDKLLDREGLFLTIEGSELLGSQDQMLTIAASRILVDNGHHRQCTYSKVLNDQEVGFFNLRKPSDIIETENHLMKLFSRAGQE